MACDARLLTMLRAKIVGCTRVKHTNTESISAALTERMLDERRGSVYTALRKT